MSDSIAKKLKKYVLYISAIFFVSFGGHLIYSYLYDGAMSEPIEWGTVSEAIIWWFPHFNPLIPSTDHNAYINSLLYRSLLEYSPESNNFEPDLVNCNLDNLLYIECTLETNLLWSNGEEITTDDIKSTLEIIRETKVNPIIASLLENTTIETSKDSISFENTSKDINFLHVFLQPIIPQSVVNTLDLENIDGKFSQIEGIYSWRFTLKNISQDETVGITKITLGKNEKYFGNDMYIQFLILNLFRDKAHFIKNKNSFNIFNDRENIIGNSIPRLSSYEYTLAQFVGSFFNTDTLSSELRAYLNAMLSREEIVEQIWAARVQEAYNPFLSDYIIDGNVDFSLSEYLEWQWYYSKKELLKSALALSLQQKQMSAETLTRLLKEQEEAQQEELPKAKVQEDLEYITSPSTQKYNFVSEDNILIEWKVPQWVDSVFINDYELSGFSAWDTIFYYRLLESYDSIREWENTYEVYYETGKEKELVEEFVYVYYSDEEKLREVEESFFDEETQSQEDTQKESEEENEDENDSEAESLSVNIRTSLTTEQIQALDENLYYTPEGKVFSLRLLFAQNDPLVSETATLLQEQFSAMGIQLQITGSSLWDITAWLRSDILDYDIALLGINLWYFDSNLYPYFHSSQVKNGYNFANFKKLGLDILLEELKSNNLSTTKREELEEKILEILEEENILKVYYTPKLHLLADKNIKNFSFPSYLPDSKHRYYSLLSAYLTEKRIIQSDEKWFFWFFSYIFHILTS